MKHNDDNDKRRSFLKQVVAGTAIIAGSTLVGKQAQAQKTTTAMRPDEVLYTKTDAFKKYYDSLR